MNTQHDNTAGKGFRVKNPPQVDGHAASAIERNYSRDSSQGVNDTTISSVSTSPSATASNVGITPAGQESGLGPPDKSARPIRREYTKIYWSLEEKKKILLAFAYSRNEKWRGQMNQIFQRQLEQSDLPRNKLDATNVSNLVSLMSQINKYLSVDEIKQIKAEGKRMADIDIAELDDANEINDLSQRQWSLEEKWTLLWATEYAKCKFKKAPDRCAEWQRIVRHHCPNKRHSPKNRLTTQKNNVQKAKLFSDEDVQDMMAAIQTLILNDLCPLQNPIHLPNAHPPEHNPVFSPPQSPQPPTPQNSPHNQSPETPQRPVSSSQSPAVNLLDEMENTFESTSNEPPNAEEDLLKDELMNTIELVRSMSMDERPRLIKLFENKKFKSVLHDVNQALHELTPDDLSTTELNIFTYGAALHIQRLLAPWFDEKRVVKRKGTRVPSWKSKLQKKIVKLRGEISQMVINEPHTASLKRKIRRIKRKYGIDDSQIQARIAEHQAEVKALAAQIRNKEKNQKAKEINKSFSLNPRKVHREILKQNIEIKNPPDKKELEQFWRPLFENPKTHTEGEWIETVKEQNKDKAHMNKLLICQEDIKRKLDESGSFKSPGIDKVPNFWLRKLNSLHPRYVSLFNKILDGTENTPEWLTQGRTTLLPKSKETHRPNKYRPICCLSTTYKLLTGLVADAIYMHLERGNYLEEEQKGCIRNRLGTKDQLLINKTILEDAKRRQRNLSMAWIDYQKAFDSVPHSWINRCLELYNVEEDIRTFLKNQMNKWSTTITLNHENGDTRIPDVKIQRGIYQGDSLSPLLFLPHYRPSHKSA